MIPPSTLILDTHASIHELVKAGMPERQAETVVRQQARLLEQNFATKHDIETVKRDIEVLRQETKANIETVKHDIEVLRQETKADIETVKHDVEVLRQETKANIETLRQETTARIETAKVDLIKWMFGLGLGIASLAVAADKLF